MRTEEQAQRAALIMNTAIDLVSNLLWYDRKEDEDLPRGEIEKAVAEGDVTADEIVDAFGRELRERLAAKTEISDTDRLDWIDQNMDCSLAGEGLHISLIDIGEDQTLRQAIDEAMNFRAVTRRIDP